MLTRVIIPYITPGLWRASSVALTYSLDDFAVTFFVTGAGFSTLSVEIYSMARRGSLDHQRPINPGLLGHPRPGSGTISLVNKGEAQQPGGGEPMKRLVQLFVAVFAAAFLLI